jgi:hypothetical protein
MAERPQCPECGRDVDASWRYCPACNADLRGGTRRPTDGAQVDIEVKRDTQGSTLGLGCFTVIGLIGFALFLFHGGLQFVYSAPVVGVILLTAVLFVLGIRVMLAISPTRDPQAAPRARSGIATVLSVVATVGVVYLGVMFSLIVFLFIVCAQQIHR